MMRKLRPEHDYLKYRPGKARPTLSQPAIPQRWRGGATNRASLLAYRAASLANNGARGRSWRLMRPSRQPSLGLGTDSQTIAISLRMQLSGIVAGLYPPLRRSQALHYSHCACLAPGAYIMNLLMADPAGKFRLVTSTSKSGQPGSGPGSSQVGEVGAFCTPGQKPKGRRAGQYAA